MNLKYQPEHYVASMWAGLASFGVCLAAVALGVSDWHWLIGTWAVYAFLALVNSAGFHRLFSHRSYTTTPFWEWFFLIVGTLSCYGSSMQWTVHHSQHHRYADTDRDPHKFGTFSNLFRVNYLVDKLDYQSLRAVKHLLKKSGHKWMHDHYWVLPACMLVLLTLLFGPLATLFLYTAPIGLVIFSAAMFNYVAHDDDGPNNRGWWTLFSSGEHRHRLHHEKPHLWILREKWYDLDPAGSFISFIRTGDGTWEP